MAYALEQLLTIRNRREDRARGELQTARQAVSQATRDLEDRRAAWAEFEATKEDRRDRIYEQVIGHSLKREDLELAREGIARIDREGVLKADNVVRAREILAQKEAEAEKAKDAYIVTAKDRSKISEHKADWQREEMREAEYRQDIELEDFTGKKLNDDRND